MTDETVKAMARAILAVLHPEWDEDNCDTVERNKGPSWQRAVRCARAAEKARPVGEVPEGWVLVPRRMDVGMIAAFWRQKNNGSQVIGQREREYADKDFSDSAAYAALVSAAPSPPEGLGNKGFMADREVEKPMPVASDATPGKETAARIIANHMMDEYEWPRKPAENLGATLEALLDWTFSDGSLESQEKTPETSSVGDKQ